MGHHAETSPGRVASVADFIRDRGIRAILIEYLSPNSDAVILKDELKAEGVQVLTLHNIASITEPELAEHSDYFGLMRNNLRNLQEALECSG